MNWIYTYDDDAINLDNIAHIWIEKSVNGFFLMGEMINTQEDVVLSITFENESECRNCFMNLFNHNQPERSKREDFEQLSEEFFNNFVSNRGGNWEEENGYILGIKEFSKWLNQRCGTLNTMET